MKELITYLLTTLIGAGFISSPDLSQLPVLKKLATHLESQAQPSQNSVLFVYPRPTSTPSASPESPNSVPQPDITQVSAYNQSSAQALPAQIPGQAVTNSPSLLPCSDSPQLCPPSPSPVFTLTPTPSLIPSPAVTIQPSVTPTPLPTSVIVIPSPVEPCPVWSIDPPKADQNHIDLIKPCAL